MLAPWKKSYDKPRQHIKRQRYHFADVGPYNLSYESSSSHVWIWELHHKEGWVTKNGCFLIVLEKSLESPLDCKDIKPVDPKGNQPWVFIGRTDAEGEGPIVWPPDMKSQLTGKDPDAGKYWGQEEKGVTEDEMLASKTQWTWIWAKLRRQWRTKEPGVLQSMGSERIELALET